jgi:hypothetical protein
VQVAILSDPALTERQRQVLLDIYNSFRRENGAVPQTAHQTSFATTGRNP